MAYSWEEIKFLGREWWAEVPFKEKVKGIFPVAVSMMGPGVYKALPMLTLFAIKAAWIAGSNGFRAINLTFLWSNFLLVTGWVVGWGLTDIDHIFYALTCDPREEICQRVKREIDLKRWKGAWKILNTTAGEREKLPIRNMVTLYVVAIMGIWVATSTDSILAVGLVFGLGVRLLIEAWQVKKIRRWYWLFKREFSQTEHKILCLIASGMIFYQAIGIIRM